MAKVTMATVKSMINKNVGKLMIRCMSSYDGMIDGTVTNDLGWKNVVYKETATKHDLGISGAWFVGNSRDFFSSEKFNSAGKLIEVSVYNSCGSFSLKVI